VSRWHPRRAAVFAVLGMTVIGGGCAYYNGVYNARQAMRHGDALRVVGRDDSASVLYARAAEAAESVLRKRNADAWRAEALLLAGRGHALSGACTAGRTRLDEYLSASGAPIDRARAQFALAVCESTLQQFAPAEKRLASLDTSAAVSRDTELQRDVRRLRVRVALSAGDVALAERLLESLGSADAPWERIWAAVASTDWARAESLLMSRAEQGDVRVALDNALEAAARAGEAAMIDRVVRAYDASSAPRGERARLALFAGDAYLQRGDSVTARSMYTRMVERLSTDTVYVRDAEARIAQLNFAAIDSSVQIRALLNTSRPIARGNAGFDRLESSAALYLLLLETNDPSGAALYLAGEVARDSLARGRLAYEAWRTLAQRWPESPLAARSLYAAALLTPDSATSLHAELLARYGTTSMASMLRGQGVDDVADLRAADALLEGRWVIATRALADTLRVWRAAWPAGRTTPP